MLNDGVHAAAPLSAGHATWLLIRLRLRRLGNLLSRGKSKPHTASGSGKPAKTRAATPAKRRVGTVLALVVTALMLIGLFSLARIAVLNLHCQLDAASQCLAIAHEHHGNLAAGHQAAAQELAQRGVAPQLAHALAFQLAMIMLLAVVMPLAAERNSGEDWDLEWLVTLPVGRHALLLARVLERSVVNPVGMLILPPSCMMLAWIVGWRWSVPLAGLLAVVLLLPVTAVVRTILDTGMRMTMSPSRLRNLLALTGVVTAPVMFMAMGFSMPAVLPVMWDLARAVPAWIGWTPPGLAVAMMTAATPGAMLAAAGALLAQTLACIALGLAVLGRQLRDGIVSGSGRESARKSGPNARRSAAARSAAGPVARTLARLAPRSPVQRRELHLLARDRQFLIQSLVMPLVMVGNQFVFTAGGLHDPFASLGANPSLLATLAFTIGAYTLMLSAFQTLNNEGKSVWMLYTFPMPIEAILRDKAKLWALLALVYPAILFALGLAQAPSLSWHTALLAAIAATGVVLFAAIAVALGVFACDPLSPDVRTKLKPSYVYLYMSLAGVYCYALYAERWWQAVTVMVLTAGLAQALWQKARDMLPYLLDPVAAPPAQVSAADGMTAALAFFGVQALGFLFLHKALGMGKGEAIVPAYAAAGLVVYGLARLIYWRTRSTGVPPLLPPALRPALLAAAAAGIAAAAFGLVYLMALRASPWWPAVLQQTSQEPRMAWYAVLALAVLAAPLCEEFIFRGLLFGGLRRSMGMAPAMALSAALFAIVHPPASMLPVFVLGLCAAWAYRRGKGLLAPMLAHAIYNAAVLAFQMTGA